MSSSAEQQARPVVFYIEPVGGHRGMHYYDFELCPALREAGADLTLITCDETEPLGPPSGLPAMYAFHGIYGGGSKWIRGVRYARALWRIAAAMQTRQVPLAHFHYFHAPPLDYLCLKWLRRLRKRIVITAHDVVPFDATPSDMPWLRRVYRQADRIIVHTEGAASVLKERFGIGAPVAAVIPHGPFLRFADEHRMDRRQARQRLDIAPDARILLFFGQVKRVKGLQHLIEAFKKVADREPHARLLIVGPEWKESFAPYESLLREHGLTERVTARIEYVPDEQAALYFSAADVVALPYTESYQSGVLYMAYSFARPVVASAVGGLQEAIEHGATGLLVPPGDPERLAEAIVDLLGDPVRAAQMGERGRALAETRFGWTDIAAKTLDVYLQALSG